MDEAKAELPLLEQLVDTQPDAKLKSKRFWLRLSFAKAEGNLTKVVEALETIVWFYREHGQGYREALAELELAAVCAEIGQPLEARGRARRAFDLLRDLISSEAAAAAMERLVVQVQARRPDPEVLRELATILAYQPQPPEEGGTV